jgi:hypothetical protein
MVAMPTWPAPSVAVAVTVLPPSTKGTPVAVKLVPPTAAATPLTLTLTAPVTVPLTARVVPVTKLRSGGEVMTIAGTLKRVTVTVAVCSLPARSMASTSIVLAPSATGTATVNAPPPMATGSPATAREATPKSSVTVPATVTSGWFVTDPGAGVVSWLSKPSV